MNGIFKGECNQIYERQFYVDRLIAMSLLKVLNDHKHVFVFVKGDIGYQIHLLSIGNLNTILLCSSVLIQLK